jgi:hypothetical protein
MPATGAQALERVQLVPVPVALKQVRKSVIFVHTVVPPHDADSGAAVLRAIANIIRKKGAPV